MTLAVFKPVPDQVGGGEPDDGEEDPIEHLRHVEALPFGAVRDQRMPHAKSCGLMFPCGPPARVVKHGVVWLKSLPNLALLLAR